VFVADGPYFDSLFSATFNDFSKSLICLIYVMMMTSFSSTPPFKKVAATLLEPPLCKLINQKLKPIYY